MLLTPAVLALTLGSLLISGMLGYAAFFGATILRFWDLKSGSELQLGLERQTYLISTLLTVALIFQFLSFFLFIYTADRLHPYFTGAMCAAGSLNANGWGYPVLVLKLATLILAGLWLIINRADNGGFDYPLIRVKYRLLLGLAPFVFVEAAAQWLYFWHLRPNIITSCCGALFRSRRGEPGRGCSVPAPQTHVGRRLHSHRGGAGRRTLVLPYRQRRLSPGGPQPGGFHHRRFGVHHGGLPLYL